MLNLDQVTLLCIETRSPDLAMFAINKCIRDIQFKKVVLVTDLKIPYSYPSNIELIQTPEIKTTEDYSNYLLDDLTHLINGSHVLIIQWDSFITNPNLWDSNFLKYDYIGAPWPHHPKTPVGNGGFSLRSVKLIKALQDKRILKRHPEDQAICIDNKLLLEKELNIQFAPLEIAERFSFERGTFVNTFGFHGLFNFSKILNDFELKQFIKTIPEAFLGGLDTYDLINNLFHEKKYDEAKYLLKKTRPKKHPKYRYHKLHLKKNIHIKYIDLICFIRNFFPVN
jgi:hypothetical protein